MEKHERLHRLINRGVYFIENQNKKVSVILKDASDISRRLRNPGDVILGTFSAMSNAIAFADGFVLGVDVISSEEENEIVAVVGSRSFTDYKRMRQELDSIKPRMIVSGGAKGADTLAEKYAESNNISTKIFKPNYEKYGRGATHIRNRKIVDNSDFIIAFWDGKGKGTLSTISYAMKAGKYVKLIPKGE